MQKETNKNSSINNFYKYIGSNHLKRIVLSRKSKLHGNDLISITFLIEKNVKDLLYFLLVILFSIFLWIDVKLFYI